MFCNCQEKAVSVRHCDPKKAINVGSDGHIVTNSDIKRDAIKLPDINPLRESDQRSGHLRVKAIR
jgi:hypothetical protein